MGSESESQRTEGRGRGFDWARFLGSAVNGAALIVVVIVGGRINSTISSAQRQADEFALYADRAAATNTLSAQVFGVLSEHVAPKLGKDFEKVALLAGLHGNFSKFMDTRPVFASFLYEIDDPHARRELKRLAQRVARRQADYLAAQGATRIPIELDWRKKGPPLPGSGKIPFEDHVIEVNILEVSCRQESGEEMVEDVANTVKAALTIDGLETSFTVSYLDVPYMDNIFLVHDETIHRIALLLLGITKTDGGDYHVEFEALHFPNDIIMPSDVPSARDLQKAIDTHDHRR